MLWLAVWAAWPRTYAQTAAGLDLQLYAGLTITGVLGTVYSIEYATDVDQTNNWRCLAFCQLPTTNYLWFDSSAPANSRRFYRAVHFAAPANLVFIPPGTFGMGSPTNELDRWDFEGPQREVTINRGFWMGKYEVTQREYQAVMGLNPSFFTVDVNRPVEQVSWYDATNFCARLAEQERKAGRIPSNCVYRLPTEAEWEYACRAWTSMPFSYGDDLGYTNLTNYAWYWDNSGSKTHPVGQKLANAWGLYDMPGNVWEWCQDWFGPYSGGSAIDPQGPARGSARVIRGGSWFTYAWHCRSAGRALAVRRTGTVLLVSGLFWRQVNPEQILVDERDDSMLRRKLQCPCCEPQVQVPLMSWAP